MKGIHSAILLTALVISVPSQALADGCAPGEPCWEAPAKPQPKPKEMIVAPPAEPVAEPAAAPAVEAPVAVEDSSKLNLSMAVGLNVMTFKCEDTHVAPAYYIDAQHDDLPLNFRIGVEGFDLEDSEQFKHTPSSQWFQQEPDYTFIRLPLSVEYVMSLADSTDVLVGGGPDLLILSGEANDTTVGLHLGARVRQTLSESFSVSVGGGYLWGEGDVSNEDYDLESAYVGTDIAYRF